jgi:hypothetical protein
VPQHSPTQHSQPHFVQSQVPFSQQPQHSHFWQLAHLLPLMAGTKAARPSAAQMKKLFMGNLTLLFELNRSLHVTTCERGKALAETPWPIQFRQTPNRIRGGRIGTASEAATYSRLTPRSCGTPIVNAARAAT